MTLDDARTRATNELTRARAESADTVERARAEESVHLDIAGLTKTICTVHGLQIVRGVCNGLLVYVKRCRRKTYSNWDLSSNS